MAKKFAHLTAQMKTEKRISRQLEQSSCTVAAAATLSITHTTSASMAVTSSSISSLQRSSSSGSSSSPHRLQHSSSCRHYKGSDRVDHPSLHSGSSGSPATSQKYHHHYHHNHLHHHSPHNSSQDTDAGNDSSSSNSNQVCKFDEKVVKKWVENIRQNELVLRFYCVTIYQRHFDKKKTTKDRVEKSRQNEVVLCFFFTRKMSSLMFSETSFLSDINIWSLDFFRYPTGLAWKITVCLYVHISLLVRIKCLLL